MTKFIARMSLLINNVIFFVSVIVAVVIGTFGFDAYKSGRNLESLYLTTLAPLVVIVTATLLCSIIALLGAIWLSIEEANERNIYMDRKTTERIDPTFTSS